MSEKARRKIVAAADRRYVESSRNQKPYAERVFVLAGNHEEFLDWCVENRKLPTIDAVYLNHVPRGLRDIQIVRVGTWWKSPVVQHPCLKAMEKPL